MTYFSHSQVTEEAVILRKTPNIKNSAIKSRGDNNRHLAGRCGILTFHSMHRPGHQRGTNCNYIDYIAQDWYLSPFPSEFPSVCFGMLSLLLTHINNPIQEKACAFKAPLLFTFLNPHLTIAFQLWQHLKCLQFHACPDLPFCPCTEQLQNVTALLSCWLAQRPPQELLLDVADTFKLLKKFSFFIPSKTKLGWNHFCFMA